MSNEQTNIESTAKPRGQNPVLKFITRLLAAIGALTLVFIVTGLAVDISEFDETSGGYEYPYTGWTGTTIDYSEMFFTSEGMYKRGRVIELYVNCETGMISWSLFGIVRGDFREFSDRAKVVHQPQVTCRELGFDTSAWDTIDDPDGLFTDLMTAQ